MKKCEACRYFLSINEPEKGACCIVPPQFVATMPTKFGQIQPVWARPIVKRSDPACQASDLVKVLDS